MLDSKQCAGGYNHNVYTHGFRPVQKSLLSFPPSQHREVRVAVKLLVGLPCPKQIKYVLDYGVPSSKESLLSCSPSLTVTTGTAERTLSIYLSWLKFIYNPRCLNNSIRSCKYKMHKELKNWGLQIKNFIAVNDRCLQFGNLGTLHFLSHLFAIELVTSYALQVHTVEMYKRLSHPVLYSKNHCPAQKCESIYRDILSKPHNLNMF